MKFLDMLICNTEYTDDKIIDVYVRVGGWGSWQYGKFKEELLFLMVGTIVVPILFACVVREIGVELINTFTLSLEGISILLTIIVVLGIIVLFLRLFYCRLQRILLYSVIFALRRHCMERYMDEKDIVKFIQNYIKDNWRVKC